MNLRKENKEISLQKIIKAAAVRIREEGFSGAGISAVMKDAGLTHGAFYSHFSNKEQLITNAFVQALDENRKRWIDPVRKKPWPDRLKGLANRYLTKSHRDNLPDSCALAAVVSDAARADDSFHKVYEKELSKTINAICGEAKSCATDPEFDEALMLMAICIGGISLSRAVDEDAFSERILAACRTASTRLSYRKSPVENEAGSCADNSKEAKQLPAFEEFPVKTFEKLRYSDTDRQGHVNNAIFSTMLETGRVELLYNPSKPIIKENRSFVVVHQSINYLAEITWPGQVDIGTRVINIGRSSVHFDHGLFQNGTCAATAKVVAVQVNGDSKRSEPLSGMAKAHLSQYMA